MEMFIVIFIFGLIIGSFANVVAMRLVLILESQWAQQCVSYLQEHKVKVDKLPKKFSKLKVFNLMFPASHCYNCKQAIKYYDNIPLLSFIILRGRCRNCDYKISWAYPAGELICGLLFLFCALKFGISVKFIFACILSTLLFILTVIDINKHLLPDCITLPGIWLGIIVNSYGIFTTLNQAVFGAVIGYLILWTIYHLHKIISKKEGMGYGDFKLLAMLGAWFGWQQLPFIILCSSLLGTVAGVYLIVRGMSKNTPFAFGPFLCLAGFVTLFSGNEIFWSFLYNV